MNKNFTIFSLIFLLITPIVGFNFLISLVGNVLLLLCLIPILGVLLVVLSFSFLKTKLKTCDECGTISLETSNSCINCGADLGDTSSINFEKLKNPGEATIEIKAEEVN